MSFPQLPAKHDGRPYLTPAQVIADDSRPLPHRVVLCWQRSLLARVRADRHIAAEPEPIGALLALAGTPGQLIAAAPDLGLALLPIGAPTVGIVIEELAARGVEAVIGLGFAGGLAPNARPGDLVVCTEAVRDEGTSYHYLPAAPTVAPDRQLTERLRAALPGARSGSTWTTDAPYRETVEEIEHFRADGVLTVDMEAAALFAVARACHIPAAAAFCVSDVLDGAQWQHAFAAADLVDALGALFAAAETALGAASAAVPPDSH